MDRLAAMQVFCAVVDTGSFAAAADRLDQSTSAVSRWVSQLESHLRVRLLNRTTRRISLTESGRAYYEQCVQWLQELDAMEAAVSSQAMTPQGTLRIATSAGFAINYLAPALAEGQHLFPELQFEVAVSGRVVDLVEEGFDLALRVGVVGSQQLVAKPIGQTSLLYLAAPSYLQNSQPLNKPADLATHNCLLYVHDVDGQMWRFRDQAGHRYEVKVEGSTRSDNAEFLLELAALGQGIICTPCYIGAPQIKAGRLVPVLTDYRCESATIYAVYPNRKHLSAKVRTFVDFMAGWLADRRA